MTQDQIKVAFHFVLPLVALSPQPSQYLLSTPGTTVGGMPSLSHEIPPRASLKPLTDPSALQGRRFDS